MDLDRKIAVITGASGGLGAATATALIEKNAKVYGLARNLGALNKLKNKLGERFVPVQLDISNHDAVTNWVTETFSEKIMPDILVNNAGQGSFGKNR